MISLFLKKTTLRYIIIFSLASIFQTGCAEKEKPKILNLKLVNRNTKPRTNTRLFYKNKKRKDAELYFL